LFALGAWCVKAGTPPAAKPDVYSVEDLLERARSVLWSQAIHLEGRILLRPAGRGGKLRRVEFDFHPHENPARAVVTLRDAFGRGIERMGISYSSDGNVSRRYYRGADFAPAPPPALQAHVADLPLTWEDLQLPFLWWKRGRLVGFQRKRGRLCRVIDVRPPRGALHGYAAIRLWVDPEIGTFLDAAAFDGGGTLVRRYEVKSFRRFGERWTIGRLDIHDEETGCRIIIKVDKLKALNAVGVQGGLQKGCRRTHRLDTAAAARFEWLDSSDSSKERKRR